MRLSSVIISYFVVGAVMWGAGIIDWAQIGIAEFFISDPAAGTPNPDAAGELEGMGGPIQSAAGTLTGPLLAIWVVVRDFVGFLFWPITVLASIGAPAEVVLLLGGTPTVAFFMGFIRVIRESA